MNFHIWFCEPDSLKSGKPVTRQIGFDNFRSDILTDEVLLSRMIIFVSEGERDWILVIFKLFLISDRIMRVYLKELLKQQNLKRSQDKY